VTENVIRHPAFTVSPQDINGKSLPAADYALQSAAKKKQSIGSRRIGM
jgi:hypothetical protein